MVAYTLDGRDLATTFGDRFAISFRATSPGVATGVGFAILDKPGGSELLTAMASEITYRYAPGIIEGELYIGTMRMLSLTVGEWAYEMTVSIEEDGTTHTYVVGTGLFRVEHEHLPAADLQTNNKLYKLNRRDLEVKAGTAMTIRYDAVGDIDAAGGYIAIRRSSGVPYIIVNAVRSGGTYTITVPGTRTDSLSGRCTYAIKAKGAAPGSTDVATIAKGVLWVRP